MPVVVRTKEVPDEEHTVGRSNPVPSLQGSTRDIGKALFNIKVLMFVLFFITLYFS